MNRQRRRVTRFEPGRRLTAAFLNTLVDGVNDSIPEQRIPTGTVDQVASRENPETTNARPQDLNDEAVQATDTAIASAGTGAVFAEVSRTVSTVRIENPDDADQYVNVERTDSVTFVAADGSSLTLQFDNG